MKKNFLFLMIFVLILPRLGAQDKMNLPLFYEMIQASNPQLKIVEIQRSLGDVAELKAKGYLDPKITSELDEKNFDDKRYYRLFDAQLKVPSSYGVDFVGGYQNTLGEYLNEQEKTPENGLFYAGIEVNLLQGLFVTHARMAKKEAGNKAEMYRQMAQKTKNAFYYSAGKNYLDWEQNQAVAALYKEVVALSENYFDQTRAAYLLGEKTAIDTLESYVAWQDWRAQWEGVKIKETQLVQKLKYYVYDELDFDLYVYDENLTEVGLGLSKVDVNALPEIREKMEKLKAYEWQGKLKKEKLKPKLKLKYMPLILDKATGNYALDVQNYKWGFGFSYHLFNRKTKADLKENDAKQDLLYQEIKLKERSLNTQLNAGRSNIENWENQYRYWENISDGYKKLLTGEQTKFAYGESSVFLITKRQEKWIKTQQKALAVYYKWQKEKLKYLYLSNQILTEFGVGDNDTLPKK